MYHSFWRGLLEPHGLLIDLYRVPRLNLKTAYCLDTIDINGPEQKIVVIIVNSNTNLISIV